MVEPLGRARGPTPMAGCMNLNRGGHGTSMRALFALAIFVIAGCAGAPPEPSPGEPPLVTDTSGVIKGVVVDETITPVASAEINILQMDVPVADTTSDVDGRFVVGNLPPGIYVIQVQANGFHARTESAVVIAGDDEPDLVKVLLSPDVTKASYAQVYHWEGLVACAATGGNFCAIPGFYTGGNPAGDASIRLFEGEFLDEGRTPDWVQIELVWEATQPATPDLQQRFTASNAEMAAIGSWNYTFGVFAGSSPLTFTIDGDTAKEARLGLEMGLLVETFAPTPGATLDQRFDEYISVFYGYTPPEGWRFVDDGALPPPPA